MLTFFLLQEKLYNMIRRNNNINEKPIVSFNKLSIDECMLGPGSGAYYLSNESEKKQW